MNFDLLILAGFTAFTGLGLAIGYAIGKNHGYIKTIKENEKKILKAVMDDNKI